MKRRYAILPGDGIGIDVTREAVKVLQERVADDEKVIERPSGDTDAPKGPFTTTDGNGPKKPKPP